MNLRAFLFIIWQTANESADASKNLLTELAKGQYRVAASGGSRIVTANVQGQSFTYELPENFSGSDFHELLRQAYKILTTCGTDGKQMSDGELSSYVLDEHNQITNTVRARFADHAR